MRKENWAFSFRPTANFIYRQFTEVSTTPALRTRASTVAQMLCNLALDQVLLPRRPSSSKPSGFPLLIMALRNLPQRTTGIYSTKSTKHISLLFSRQLLKYLEHTMSKTSVFVHLSPKRKICVFSYSTLPPHDRKPNLTITAHSCTLLEQVQWRIYFQQWVRPWEWFTHGNSPAGMQTQIHGDKWNFSVRFSKS